MDSFRYQVEIAAPPVDVYRALTTKQGIQGWWTPDCDVPSAEGELLKVRFGEMYHTYRIESLHNEQLVQWKCTEHFHNLPGLTRFDEWVGTELVFQITDHRRRRPAIL